MKRRDELDQTEQLQEAGTAVPVARGHVVVVAGPDVGRKLVIEAAPVTIGSGAGADLELSDRAASRRHVEISVTPRGFLLRDLDSRNGTFVNGSRVREVYLGPGDQIAIGRTELTFEPKHEEVRIPPSTSDRFGPLFGKSLAMRRLFGVLARVAPTDTTLLLAGETGSGKDLVARAVHQASRRAAKPIIVFDCSAVSPDLIASELFGHVEGAFTGAKGRRAGAFEAASGGTLFLDEIGELPSDLQPKLLRALEAREVRPVGANTAIPVDCRVIAATHRDLPRMVAAGTFREDLYFRLAVVRLTLPPLARRREDVPGLVEALVAAGRAGRRVTFTPAALERLARHTWPGNVRELRNVIERTVALSPGDEVGPEDLAFDSAVEPELTPEVAPPPASAPVSGKLEDLEREAILDALKRSGGNQKEAARLLGIHRNTLANKLKALGIKA